MTQQQKSDNSEKTFNLDGFKQFLIEKGATNPWKYVADLARKSGHCYDKNQIYATPEDLPILETYNAKVSDKNKFVLDILPCPIVGDIFNAKIIVLTLNPGFLEKINHELYTELNIEEQKQVTDFHIENLELCATTLFPNDAVNRIGDRYWESKTKELRQKYGFQNADFAIVQNIAYQSEKFKDLQGLKRLKSIEFTRLLIEFIIQYRKDDYVFVIARRKKDFWEPLLRKFFNEDEYNKHVTELNTHKAPAPSFVTKNNLKNFEIIERLMDKTQGAE